MKLPEEFLKRMQGELKEDFPAFLQSYDLPPCKGLRVNTLKIGLDAFVKNAPFPLGDRIDWEPRGFYIEEEKAGGLVEHFAGLYYLQEPSAMCVGKFTAPCKKTRVLDMCAAPGGKSVMLAMQMAGDGILISNEIDGARAKILSQNMERTGVKNGAVTSAAPRQLAKNFPEYFDLILADAPCSGEGMFKKEPEAIPHWSEQNVALCVARQRDILEEAAKMLRRDGVLIYSTCTFSKEEDEGQIAAFLNRHPEFVLEEDAKLYPHQCRGEGHYCARLLKREGGVRDARPYPIKKNARAERAFYEFAKDFFVELPQGEITTLDDGRMYLVSAGMPVLSVRVLRLGVELGEWDGKVFKPAHALAMSLKRGECRRFLSLPREQAERYLRGETLACDGENGWCVVGFCDYPLGLGKIVNGALKNHYPKGLRMIRA